MIASTQINLGEPELVADGDQAVEVAKLNLDAGKKAMNMSDFFSAYSFLEYGISYLQKGHWDTNYDLSLELFNLSSGCGMRSRQIAEAIKMTTSTLNDLGEGIPKLITPSRVDESLKVTKEKLARYQTTLC
eukprot:scaffold5769_cov73-Skeletonema_marinoi.AAC.1